MHAIRSLLIGAIFITSAIMEPVVVHADTTGGGVVTIRPDAAITTRQGLPNFVGISGDNTGAKGISMNLVVIPAGAAAKPHLHRGYETAIYILKGRVRTRYGEGLCQSVVNEAGDFVFIPADVPHQPVNLSTTEEARAIVARTDPNEQESVELYNRPTIHADCDP
ncbi:MAG: cupin domain-containing protein [Gammaproteobacteria bacterium]|nr:cupin domain-containing protein [Gammaproteobacteria bacterium]